MTQNSTAALQMLCSTIAYLASLEHFIGFVPLMNKILQLHLPDGPQQDRGQLQKSLDYDR